jgi:hypothetical protein
VTRPALLGALVRHGLLGLGALVGAVLLALVAFDYVTGAAGAVARLRDALPPDGLDPAEWEARCAARGTPAYTDAAPVLHHVQ